MIDKDKTFSTTFTGIPSQGLRESRILQDCIKSLVRLYYRTGKSLPLIEVPLVLPIIFLRSVVKMIQLSLEVSSGKDDWFMVNIPSSHSRDSNISRSVVEKPKGVKKIIPPSEANKAQTMFGNARNHFL
ncbi:hypothetical protein NQ317_006201 [Molorchus minor]|uniref:Maturase K n=1 Tax=Molorchus minor TaxID=1323400 RepID=A0ABQ9ITH3_9CUCU|nr:hypothetical protein NQ317_006201 [Molorchus minor]